MPSVGELEEQLKELRDENEQMEAALDEGIEAVKVHCYSDEGAWLDDAYSRRRLPS